MNGERSKQELGERETKLRGEKKNKDKGCVLKIGAGSYIFTTGIPAESHVTTHTFITDCHII